MERRLRRALSGNRRLNDVIDDVDLLRPGEFQSVAYLRAAVNESIYFGDDLHDLMQQARKVVL